MLLLGLATLAAGCFEEPVTEELELRFPDGDSVEVTSSVTLRVPQGETSQAALRARLDALERDLLGGASPWSRRFANLEATREGQAWQREGGRLEWFRQWATADPGRLADFFADTPVQVAYTRRDETSELAFYPGPGTRATSAEARKVEAALAPWIDSVAGYAGTGSRLWRYLRRHPERRRACLAYLFEVEQQEDTRLTISPTEERMLDLLNDSMTEVAAVLRLPSEEPETFDELARRVYDPYPAAIKVVVAGRVVAAEGLKKNGEDGWEIPSRSPWLAVSSLAGRWFSPDPLLARIAHARQDAEKDFDLDAFLAQPFASAEEPPRGPEVRQALLAALARPTASRLEWEPPTPSPRTSWRPSRSLPRAGR